MKEEIKEYLLAVVIFLMLLAGLMFSNKASGQTLKEVKKYMDEIGVEKTEIVIKQVIEETGWLKCVNCSMDKNNLFGFRYKKKYLQFDNWKAGCDYLKRWQVRKGYNGGNYYEFLARIGWATNPNYIKNIKSINYE